MRTADGSEWALSNPAAWAYLAPILIENNGWALFICARTASSGTRRRAFKKTPEHNWASHGADAWRYLSLSWRAPMRQPEPEKVPIGIPLPDMTMDQFMGLEWTSATTHWPKVAQAALAPYIRRHVVAYFFQAFTARSAGWFHPPVSASRRRQATCWLGLVA